MNSIISVLLPVYRKDKADYLKLAVESILNQTYGDFHIYRVYASRAINANPSKRGKLTELLIKNYE